MTKLKFKPGCKKSPHDSRDYKLDLPPLALPAAFSLRHLQSTVRDQKDLGSCTAFAMSSMLEYFKNLELVTIVGEHRKVKFDKSSVYTNVALCREVLAGFKQIFYSPLWIYYFERELENSVNEDSGAYIRDGMRVLRSKGAALESEYPYRIAKFKNRPPEKLLQKSMNNQIITYYNIGTTTKVLKSALLQGKCVVFGVEVHDNFFSLEAQITGNISMPEDDNFVGGHAMLLTGYNDKRNGGSFQVKNSWGRVYGDHGYLWIPYEYIVLYGMDCWTVNTWE